MDVRISVAVSMLPVSRLAAAARFKDLSTRGGDGDPTTILQRVLHSSTVAESDWRAVIEQALAEADGALRAAAHSAMQPIPLGDARYPVLLACIPDPPPVLWVRGDPGILHQPTVAVVGSRAATTYALEVADRLCGELAGRGIGVASGLARGVDSAAHRGCLTADGVTIGVLGCGLDRVYPAEHTELAANICRKGALVSELGPGAPPLPEHFPLRNRIISGISLAVVVVEASEKSGSLITARCGLEQGRDVMAVPGSVLTGRNRGSHGLLKDGAKVVETADDILDGLGWTAAEAPRAPSAAFRARVMTDPLLARMEPGEVYQLDELIALTGMSGPRLLTRLTELELLGLVAAAGLGRFGRVVT
jgi:DNA processing protein